MSLCISGIKMCYFVIRLWLDNTSLHTFTIHVNMHLQISIWSLLDPSSLIKDPVLVLPRAPTHAGRQKKNKKIIKKRMLSSSSFSSNSSTSASHFLCPVFTTKQLYFHKVKRNLIAVQSENLHSMPSVKDTQIKAFLLTAALLELPTIKQ